MTIQFPAFRSIKLASTQQRTMKSAVMGYHPANSAEHYFQPRSDRSQLRRMELHEFSYLGIPEKHQIIFPRAFAMRPVAVVHTILAETGKRLNEGIEPWEFLAFFNETTGRIPQYWLKDGVTSQWLLRLAVEEGVLYHRDGKLALTEMAIRALTKPPVLALAA